MNKRSKKKRKDASKLEVLEKAHYELKRDYRWAMIDLDSCKREVLVLRAQAFRICSHSMEPSYPTGSSVETHHLEVNTPLRIDHTGFLTEYDVHRLADSLAEALHKEAISQLMPHAKSIRL